MGGTQVAVHDNGEVVKTAAVSALCTIGTDKKDQSITRQAGDVHGKYRSTSGNAILPSVNLDLIAESRSDEGLSACRKIIDCSPVCIPYIGVQGTYHIIRGAVFFADMYGQSPADCVIYRVFITAAAETRICCNRYTQTVKISSIACSVRRQRHQIIENHGTADAVLGWGSVAAGPGLHHLYPEIISRGRLGDFKKTAAGFVLNRFNDIRDGACAGLQGMNGQCVGSVDGIFILGRVCYISGDIDGQSIEPTSVGCGKAIGTCLEKDSFSGRLKCEFRRCSRQALLSLFLGPVKHCAAGTGHFSPDIRSAEIPGGGVGNACVCIPGPVLKSTGVNPDII